MVSEYVYGIKIFYLNKVRNYFLHFLYIRYNYYYTFFIKEVLAWRDLAKFYILENIIKLFYLTYKLFLFIITFVSRVINWKR